MSQTPASSAQVGGAHYKDLPIQPSEFSQRNGLHWCEANVVKYVCRHRNKNGRQDIEKAIHYLQLLLEWEYPETDERLDVMATTVTEAIMGCPSCMDQRVCGKKGFRLDKDKRCLSHRPAHPVPPGSCVVCRTFCTKQGTEEFHPECISYQPLIGAAI